MSDIKSFVRRNSRLTDSHKNHLQENNGYLCQDFPVTQLQAYDYVGLEVGFGMGDSLLDAAQQDSSQLWIGIEVYEIGVASVIRQAKALSLNNLQLISGDAVTILSDECPEQSIDHVRIFFPDPWPKKRHMKRRIMQKNMLNSLGKIMKPGGKLHFATDNLNYAEETQSLLMVSDKFTIVDEMLHRPETKFAQKAIEAGSVITDIVAIKEEG